MGCFFRLGEGAMLVLVVWHNESDGLHQQKIITLPYLLEQMAI